MTHALTFEQVREAGVFAWRPDHYVYADGRLLRDVGRLEDVRTADAPLHFKPSVLKGSEPFLNGNWRHLDDCVCFVCAFHQAYQQRLPLSDPHARPSAAARPASVGSSRG